MPMKNPPHPGDFIRTEIIEPAGLSVTAAAAALRVSRPALSSLLNNKADLSGDMALRIEKAFGVEMETLMRMQSAFDIAKTRSREKEIPRAVLSSPRRGPPVDPCFAKVCSGDEGGMHVSAVRPPRRGTVRRRLTLDLYTKAHPFRPHCWVSWFAFWWWRWKREYTKALRNHIQPFMND